MPFVMPLVIEVSGGRSLSSARHQATLLKSTHGKAAYPFKHSRSSKVSGQEERRFRVLMCQFRVRAGQTNETCSPTERESANPKHRPPTIPIELPTLPLLLLLGGEEKDKGQRKETEEYAKGKREKKAIRGYSTRWGRACLWRAGLPMNTNTRIRLGFRSLIGVGGSGKQAVTGGRVEAGTAGAGTLTFSPKQPLFLQQQLGLFLILLPFSQELKKRLPTWPTLTRYSSHFERRRSSPADDNRFNSWGSC
ncbi:hypothetical protein CRG98_046253 [Punica granatum]|uniref:Uncharacterized protein n=1 Tax=Punica granatum TaxID=22663 RepID=A0A2I0HPZ4_PUNGR|nr:hypothetical protein CRG98_046253 [Punica granatum]